MFANRRIPALYRKLVSTVEEHEIDVRFQNGSTNEAVLRMCIQKYVI